MWKAWLAAAVVGIGVLVAVILLGRQLVEPERLDPALVVAAEPTWADRASSLCNRSLGAVRDVLATPNSLGTPEERAVALFAVTTEIEGQLAANLRALPAPPAQRAQIDEAVGKLEEQYDRDRLVGGLLEQRYNATLLRQAIEDYERRATRIRELFGVLGAGGCVRYLDPASYR